MIPAHVLKAMARAGCTVEQLVAVVQADEAINEQRLERRREKTRLRVQAWRERNAGNALQGVTGVTERYEKGNSEQNQQSVTHVTRDLLSPEGSSPKPLSPKPLSTPSSLRSEDARAREEFHENFWPRYPNKVGKADAERSFAKARRQASLAAILAGLDRYVAKTDDRPWCNPATWLNQARWTDQPAEVPRQARASPYRNSDDMLAALKRRLGDDDDEDGDGPGDHKNSDYPLLGFAAKGHERE
jgi:hypothetical protein